MPAISESDIDAILEISGVAVECVDEVHFPPALFRQMTELFGSKSCVYYSMSEDLDNHPIWDGVGYNLSGVRIQQYEDHYRAFDPCFAGLRSRAVAGRPLVVSTDQVIPSEGRYVSSGYYRDFLLPQRIHNSIIFGVGDSQGMLGLFGFHRAAGKPVYGSDEHLKAKLFASQIAGALRLKSEADSHLRTRALVRKLMERAGVREYLVLDRHWRIVDSAGAAVSSLLGLSGSVRVVDDSNGNVSPSLPRDIKGYLSGELAKHETSVRAGARLGDAHRIFEDIPGWPRALVDLLELDGSLPLYLIAFLGENHDLVSESKLADFALTPREREVVHKVSRGLTTVQIADELRISEKTVEHHLDHIYRKTGTHNRTALVYRLSG